MTAQLSTNHDADVRGNALHILIADDHAIVREGIKRILEATHDPWVVLEASNGFEALERMRSARVDLAVIDLSMPGMGGMELLQRAHAEFPAIGLLVLSVNSEDQYAMRAFKAGALGYITKDRAAQELVGAVRKAAGGRAYVSASLAEHMVLRLGGGVAAPRHTQLSNRELDVLTRLVGGQRPTDIANALHLSVKTVSTHKTRIQAKLRLPSTAALLRYGMEHGLCPQDSARLAQFDDRRRTKRPMPLPGCAERRSGLRPNSPAIRVLVSQAGASAYAGDRVVVEVPAATGAGP